jgi:two-component system sensor histidine kinase DegS
MGNRPDFSPTMVWQLTHTSAHANGKASAPYGSLSHILQPKRETMPLPAASKESEIVARERRRIACEIHDGVAQDLAALSLKVRLCQRQLENDPAGLSTELDEIRSNLDTTLVELRRIVCGLRPVSLEEHGFIPALHALAAELSARHPIYIHLSISGDERYLPHSLELPLFRMAQEALNNVVQHAQATYAQITLSLMPDALTFSIEDNGSGFTTTALWDKIRHGHLGLQQMRERIAVHHGTLSIQSEVGQGTRIVATFSHA